jgi:hypothetical protein
MWTTIGRWAKAINNQFFKTQLGSIFAKLERFAMTDISNQSN